MCVGLNGTLKIMFKFKNVLKYDEIFRKLWPTPEHLCRERACFCQCFAPVLMNCSLRQRGAGVSTVCTGPFFMVPCDYHNNALS